VDRNNINRNIQVEAADVIAVLTDKIADVIAENAVLIAQVKALSRTEVKTQD
jgi:hypothetical protein